MRSGQLGTFSRRAVLDRARRRPARAGHQHRPGLSSARRAAAAPPPSGGPAMRRGPLAGARSASATGPPPPVNDEEEETQGQSRRLGSAADRAGRRARRSERAGERRPSLRRSPPRPSWLTRKTPGAAAPASKKSRSQRLAVAAVRKAHIEIEPPITVRSLSEAIGIKAQDLLRKLMAMNQMVTINASLDDELAVMLAMEFGSELVVVHPRTAEDEMLDAFAAAPISRI